MKIAVISHKKSWRGGESPTGVVTIGGFPQQMAALAELFSQMVIYLPAETSTARLSKAKFCTLIEGVLEMAAEQDGIYLDAPDQYRKAKQQEARRLARLAQKGQAA